MENYWVKLSQQAKIQHKTSLFCFISIALFSPCFSYAVDAKSAPNIGSSSTTNRSRITSSTKTIKVAERTDNVVTAKKQKLSAREAKEKKGGISRSEIETIGLERELSRAIDEEIKNAERLIAKLGKKESQRPDILRRLIEIYHQKAMLVFFEENRIYDSQWKAWDKQGRKGAEPMLQIKVSKAWTSKVIQKAMQFITEYPKQKYIDEIYFQIAFAYNDLGERNKAAEYYSQLIAKFPSSHRIPDAHFSMGEFYFDKQDFKKAIISLKQIERFSRSMVFPWSVYKIGWCYFNLQDYNNSLAYFKRVVELSGIGTTEISKSGRLKLKDEALKDMVNVYAELNNIDDAEKYFNQIGGGDKYLSALFIRLADLLRDKGEYEKSIQVLKRFVMKNPYAINSATIQIQIIDTSDMLADKKTLWIEMRNLLANYKPETPWGQKNAANPEFKNVLEKIHTVAVNYPKKSHKVAQENKNKYMYDQAKIGYTIYLNAYGFKPESAEIHFLYGEILYQENNYAEADKQFQAIVLMGDKNPYFARAVEYLISSSYLMIEPDLKKMRANSVKLNEPRNPVAPTMLEYLKSCDLLLKYFPKDKHVIDCEVDAAEIFLKTHNYPEAEIALSKLVKNYSTRAEGKNAAEILLLFAAKDKKKLLARALEFEKIPSFNQGDFGKRIAAIKDENKFELALELETANKHAQAADAFKKLATENPKGSNADKAWFNAGVNYRKTGNVEDSVASFKKVLDYPNAAQAPDAVLNIIELSSDVLLLAQAAEYSTLFGQKFPKDKRASVVNKEACYLHDSLNNVQKATAVCTQIMQDKNDPGRFDAAFVLADMYERNQKWTSFLQIVDDVVLKESPKVNDKVKYLIKAANAERRMGKVSNAKAREDKAMALFKSSPKAVSDTALSGIGKIEFENQRPQLAAFKSLRLLAPNAAGLMTSTKKKMDAVPVLEQSFKKVVATGDPEWSVAALYTFGAACEMFAAELKNPPMPPGVNAAQTAEIKKQFGTFATPLEEKAKAIYLTAADIVTKNGIYTEYSQRNYEALVRVSPKEFKRISEWLPEGSFVGTQWMEVPSVSKAVEKLGGSY